MVNETVTQSEESITLMTPYGVLSIYLLTVADPSRSFRMTFNVSLTMTPYTIRSHSALLADSSQLTADSSQLTANSFQLTADSFYLLTAFLTTGTDPSHSLRMTINVSLHYDSFSSNRHSERTQECLAKKTGNGMVTRSEESITRMASYRFPRYASRSFTFASDDD